MRRAATLGTVEWDHHVHALVQRVVVAEQRPSDKRPIIEGSRNGAHIVAIPTRAIKGVNDVLRDHKRGPSGAGTHVFSQHDEFCKWEIVLALLQGREQVIKRAELSEH